SPPSAATIALLVKVRMVLLRARLATRRFSDWRRRFRPDKMRAMRSPLTGPCVCSSSPGRKASALPDWTTSRHQQPSQGRSCRQPCDVSTPAGPGSIFRLPGEVWVRGGERRSGTGLTQTAGDSLTPPTVPCPCVCASTSGLEGVIHLEGDLGVDAVLRDRVVLHDRLELLDVDRLDVVHGLRCVPQRLLRGVVPALVRLR